MLILPEGSELVLIRGLHGGSTGSPGSGANFAVLVSVLEGLNEAEGLLDITTDGEVTDGDVSHDTLIVNDIGGTESDTSIITVLNEAAVLPRDFLGGISDHWDVHLAETALLAVLLGVLHVNEVRVNGGTNDLASTLSESLGSIGVLADLSRAHKGEVKGPEEENNVLSYTFNIRNLKVEYQFTYL
jgi:hypothetical protein